jgi:uncharacterized protein YoxC
MNPLNISLVVLSVAVLLIALFSIPFLLQIWRTTKGIAETLELLNKSLPGILKNLEEITENINRATSKVNDKIDGVSVALGKVQAVVGFIADMERIFLAGIRFPFIRSMGTGVALIKGMRVFLDTFRRPAPR